MPSNPETVAAAFVKLDELRDDQYHLFQKHIMLEGTKDEDESAVLQSMLQPKQGL